MPIDYVAADRILDLSFGKLNRSARMDFPKPGTLSDQVGDLIDKLGTNQAVVSHQNWFLFGSAGVEMWHRAIHSFLWSLALTERSPLWASVSGYYSSHFVMRAFAHSMGIFKSFSKRKAIQIIIDNGQFSCVDVGTTLGEHPFYWKTVKEHPKFVANPLFRENSERNPKSDSAHRTFANYTDHVGSFLPIEIPDLRSVSDTVERISHIRLHSITEPSRDDFPDLRNVQILAFQRIVAFHDFMEDRIPQNRFWRAHRRPTWCNNIMQFQVANQEIEQPLAA